MTGKRSKHRAASPGDIGPHSRGRLWLEGHAEVSVELRKTEGRRAHRVYIHDRLFRDAVITRREWDEGEGWWKDHAIAEGARLFGTREVRIRGSGVATPSEYQVNAITRLRYAYAKVGDLRAAILCDTICDGLSVRSVAGRLFGSTNGDACNEITALVVGALGVLAGKAARAAED